MKELLKKLTNEKNELHNKIIRLEQFINYESEKIKSRKHEELLTNQLNIMREYESVLELRIEDIRKEYKK